MDFLNVYIYHICLAALIVLVYWAAFSDFAYFVIPNRLSASIAGLYPSYVLAAPVAVDWQSGLFCAAILFGLGFLLFIFRLAGGGDVKLLCAIGLWAGPSLVVPFLIATAMAGGMISLAAIVRIQWTRPRPEAGTAFGAWLSPILEERIPYGAAIAVGALYVVAALLRS